MQDWKYHVHAQVLPTKNASMSINTREDCNEKGGALMIQGKSKLLAKCKLSAQLSEVFQNYQIRSKINMQSALLPTSRYM